MKPNFKRQQQVLTGREARRYQAREEKAKSAREQYEAFKRLSPEERARYKEVNAAVDRIQRNGITIDDLSRNYDRGFREGYEQGAQHSLKSTYAAVCLTLKELHGFGAKRCLEVLRMMDEKILYSLTDEELIEQVFEIMKLTLNFKEVFPEDRIAEAE